MKLKKGDEVIVLSGKDKGKKGRVLVALPQLNKVTVDGINMVKRSYKPTNQAPKGGIKEEPRPLWVSKVAIVHPDHPKRGSRVGYGFDKTGLKHRVYKQAKSRPLKKEAA